MHISFNIKLWKLSFGHFQFNIHFPSKRDWKFLWEKIKYGYSSDELWNLSYHLAKYILPRLEAFVKMSSGHPSFLTEEKWMQIKEDMIFAMKCVVDENHGYDSSKDYEGNERRKRDKRVRRGLKYFGEYFESLWI